MYIQNKSKNLKSEYDRQVAWLPRQGGQKSLWITNSGQQCYVKDVFSVFFFEVDSSQPSEGAG